jgi:1-acyl-sn-glycerol-3-phosphate acyltransferase
MEMPRVPRSEPRAENQPPKPKTDATLRALGRLVLTAFFREIEVTGVERFPAKGPVIVVANHFNSLIDGVLVTSYLPRIPRLLAASTIWDYKLLRPLLSAAGVIPVYRQRDPGAKTAREGNILKPTWGLLQAGGVLALFPEGVSHDRPYLMPLKSGVARIVLESQQMHGPLGITILPVGLIFDSKTKFRSRVLVQIGEPIEIAPILKTYEHSDTPAQRTARRQITQKIEKGLHSVAPNFESWDDARIIGRAADIWDQRDPILPAKLSLADTFKRRRAFGQAYTWMKKHHPDMTSAARNALIEYGEHLSAAGLRDEQVGASYPLGSVLGFVARSLIALFVRLPLSVVGTVLNWMPFQISRIPAQGKGRDKIATWSIFTGLILFPALWLIQALILSMIATRWFDPQGVALVFVIVLLAAPITGPVTLHFHDHRRRLFHEARAWIILKTRKNLARKLTRKRHEVLGHLEVMSKVYVRETS